MGLEIGPEPNYKPPFTPEEQEVMDLLVQAHNKFCKLPPPSEHDGQAWVQAFHTLQNVLIYRVVKRDYPTVFR